MSKWKKLPTELCSNGGRRSQDIQALERLLNNDRLPFPIEFDRLRTIVSVDHLLSNVIQLDLFQGSRLNNYHLLINGNKWIHNTTATKISIQMREKLGLKYIIE